MGKKDEQGSDKQAQNHDPKTQKDLPPKKEEAKDVKGGPIRKY